MRLNFLFWPAGEMGIYARLQFQFAWNGASVTVSDWGWSIERDILIWFRWRVVVAYPKYDVLGKVSSDWVGSICFCLTLLGLPQSVVVWGNGWAWATGQYHARVKYMSDFGLSLLSPLSIVRAPCSSIAQVGRNHLWIENFGSARYGGYFIQAVRKEGCKGCCTTP